MQLAYPDINDFSIARTDGVALAEEAVTTTPANAAYSYPAQDHLGTGRFVYNQSKTQTGAFEHYAYGARYSASGTAPYHEFTGKPWDADASLYYFPYRYYRPDMERWMSPDPLGLVDGPNVYGYVKENPVFYLDPLGEELCEKDCKKMYEDCRKRASLEFSQWMQVAWEGFSAHEMLIPLTYIAICYGSRRCVKTCTASLTAASLAHFLERVAEAQELFFRRVESCQKTYIKCMKIAKEDSCCSH